MRLFAEANRFEGVPVAQWLRRPKNSPEGLPGEIRDQFEPAHWGALEIDLKYEGYITRQEAAVERLRSNEEKRIPPAIRYEGIRGLRAETCQKLAQVRPETLGQAARISGVTPADLALLSIVIQRPSRV